MSGSSSSAAAVRVDDNVDVEEVYKMVPVIMLERQAKYWHSFGQVQMRQKSQILKQKPGSVLVWWLQRLRNLSECAKTCKVQKATSAEREVSGSSFSAAIVRVDDDVDVEEFYTMVPTVMLNRQAKYWHSVGQVQMRQKSQNPKQKRSPILV